MPVAPWSWLDARADTPLHDELESDETSTDAPRRTLAATVLVMLGLVAARILRRS